MASLKNVSLEEKASVFDSHGYNLCMNKRAHASLSIEETIISVLADSEPEPRLLEGIPVLLVKNKINYPRLKKLIDRYHLWNEFGYFGEFALNHNKDNLLRDLVNYCHTKLKPPRDISGLNFDSFKKFRGKKEKYWQIRGAPLYKEIKQQFARYNE